MYNPAAFNVTDPAAQHALMAAHPLATLVVQGADGLDAHHIPLLFVPGAGQGVLRGHVARANPLWRACEAGIPALAIFQGPDAYVSPSWYPAKAETGKVVPTWNYAVVHAHGTLRAIDDAAWLMNFLETLTARHEAGFAKPWKMSDAPRDYIDAMVKAVVGIEFNIVRLEGKWKASQNRPVGDLVGVVRGLRERGAEEMAQLVEQPAGRQD